MQSFDISIPLELKFFRNSGTKYIFKALAVENIRDPEVQKKLANFVNRISSVKDGIIDQDLLNDIKRAGQISSKMSGFAQPIIDKCKKGGSDWRELKADKLKGLGRFIRYRIGSRILEDHDGSAVELFGVWFAIETNTGDNSRGLITEIQKGSDVNPMEAEEAIKQKDNPPPNVYLQLPEDTTEVINCELTLDDESGATFPCKLTIKVQAPNGSPIPVDLILDLGNSRTVALILQHGSNEGFRADEFADNCRPINLNPSFWKARIANYRKNDDSIINSSIILQTPLFEKGETNDLGDARAKDLYLDEWEFEPKKNSKTKKTLDAFSDATKEKGLWGGLWHGVKNAAQTISADTPVEFQVKSRTKRIPQMFVRLSPVLLGEEALNALNRSAAFQNASARFMQSSPKRYYWDLDPEAEHTFWDMLPPPWEPVVLDTKVPPLRCQLLRYMPINGDMLQELDYNPESSQKQQTASGGKNDGDQTYPRAATLTWMLLAILERAWEQINLDTEDFRHKKLNNIIITYPSGWLPCEVEMYRRRCEEAVNIFAKTNFAVEDQERIRLVMEIDEAIASQMPFVFTEITQFGNAKHWIELMGKHRGSHATVRIMNLDIGGGTTDFSIIEFSHCPFDAGTKLAIDLKFKDGFAVAGDHLLRIIIDRVILGALRQTSKSFESSILEHFKDGQSTTRECLKRSMHVQRVLVPLAIHFLKLHNRHSSSYTFSPQDAGLTMGDWKSFLMYLKQDGEIPLDKMINFKNEDMSHYIEELFESNLAVCAKYATLYDVDLLVVSGKTSEIPDITALIHALFPLPADRIISTKNYKTGKWYPHFDEASELNCISDAKTVTAVGAALHFALSKGLISNWRIDNRQTSCQDTSSRNLWCTIGDLANDVDPNPSSLKKIIKQDEEEGTCHIASGTVFYRQSRDGAHPEPVFMFHEKSGSTLSEEAVKGAKDEAQQKFHKKSGSTLSDDPEYDVKIQRATDEFGGEILKLVEVYVHQEENADSSNDHGSSGSRENLVDKFEIVLHPAGRSGYAANWQESGLVIR